MTRTQVYKNALLGKKENKVKGNRIDVNVM